ncbi:hypothetical protein QZH56_36985 (plasmid) [Streptomyces olivoreticuli]|uniref:hypothetical protein n=1 Tax=Streptomyces olivoreticuli TaxID=68246 RepID=UPI002657E193|nr:hypothetical protein [Streptomyces olivoreticuli]WKK27848.1 hypothetical protein QZH56_36985 [Streptomyces olivoreticuli]
MSDGRGGAGLRPPRTTWEFAVSAADTLVLWHAKDGDPRAGEEPLRLQTVVLLAAAIYQWAGDENQDGAAVAGVPLKVLADVLRGRASEALNKCPAPVGSGAKERAYLLDAHGTASFETVRRTALEVVLHHLDDAASVVTIADRRRAFQEADMRHGLGFFTADEAEF